MSQLLIFHHPRGGDEIYIYGYVASGYIAGRGGGTGRGKRDKGTKNVVSLYDMKRLSLLLLLAAGLLTAAKPAFAQGNALTYLENQIRSGVLKGAAVGFLATDAQGKVIASLNADERSVPASNLKLVTTGTALHALGHDYRFQTRLGYTGTILEDGTLQGDLYIIGGGDPTLGAGDNIGLKTDALFWRWKKILADKGITRITGRIIGDGRAWEGNLENSSWSYDDTGTYYGAGASALCFYKNATDWDVKAGEKAGAEVPVSQTYPETPWMHFRNYSFTGGPGTGNSLYLYTTDLAPYAEMRGTFATDRKPKTEHFANKYGALTCAYYFWKNLRATGWEVGGGYADIDRGGYLRGADFVPGEKAGTPTLLGASDSPALKDIARETNVRSDNFYAESLFRTMGESATGIAVYDSCRVAVQEVLLGLGLPLDGLYMEDGSGLSRKNHVSPAFLAAFLRQMTLSPAFPAFLASLPHPGEGTLAGVLPQLEGKERLCFKSGSMEGTLCYSGYILDGEGKPAVIFSLLTNNATSRPSEVRAVLTRAIALLMP